MSDLSLLGVCCAGSVGVASVTRVTFASEPAGSSTGIGAPARHPGALCHVDSERNETRHA